MMPNRAVVGELPRHRHRSSIAAVSTRLQPTAITGRVKFVRIEFVQKVKQSEHWQHRTMVPNLLAKGADIRK